MPLNRNSTLNAIPHPDDRPAVNPEKNPVVPPEWEAVESEGLNGVLMVVGAPDSGKSTFAKWLFHRLTAYGRIVGFLDGDPGQSELGPPATVTLAAGEAGTWRRFIGSVTPAGHMLEMLTGTAALVQTAVGAGLDAVVHDTCGLVAPDKGGGNLKWAKIGLLRPSHIFALERGRELAHILEPLHRLDRPKVIELPVSPAASIRDTDRRRRHRTRMFEEYFKDAAALEIHWPEYAVFPRPYFEMNRLAGLNDRDGFVIGLGIVEEIQTAARRVTLRTPVPSLENVRILHLGGMVLDPSDFSEIHVRVGEAERL